MASGVFWSYLCVRPECWYTYGMRTATLLCLLTPVILLGSGCAVPVRQEPAAPTPLQKEDARKTTPRTSDSACDAWEVSLAKALASPQTVECLDLSFQDRTGALPAEIRHLSSLRRLVASDNRMTGIPAEIGQLSELEYLDYSDNAIDTMPNEIANLKKLKYLSLANNGYRSVPDSVVSLKGLTALDLRGNPIPVEDIERARKEMPGTQIAF